MKRFLMIVLLLCVSANVFSAVFDTTWATKDQTEEKKEKRTPKGLKAPNAVPDGIGNGLPEGASGADGLSGSSGKKGFYNVEVKGNRNVLFIVDTSSSMGTMTPEGGTRLSIMKRELVFAIKNAVDEIEYEEATPGSFRIIQFNSYIDRFPTKGKADFRTSNLLSLKKYVKSMQDSGSTCMMEAWITAAKIIKREKPVVDTIYFLTDGEPTDCTEDGLVDYINQKIPKHIVIHCFSIGGSSRLMEKIAKQHNGKYIPKL